MEYSVIASDQERQFAYSLRSSVFVVEQGVPEDMELDEYDPNAVHVVAKKDNKIIGTGRYVAEETKARIGRMAVDKEYRGKGVGTGVLKKLEEVASSQGLKESYLHSQLHARDFYLKHGYVERGEEFDEAGIAHIEMYKLLLL
jgi:predicted GNAT family N-acyltransferase